MPLADVQPSIWTMVNVQSHGFQFTTPCRCHSKFTTKKSRRVDFVRSLKKNGSASGFQKRGNLEWSTFQEDALAGGN